MITESEHDKLVSEMLARWRTEAGFTQLQMAQLLGISRAQLQMIEYNQCRVKSYTIIQWACLTGHDPVLCMSQILYPDRSFHGSRREKQLLKLSSAIKSFSDDEIDGIVDFLCTDHGSDRKALVHLFSCYCRLSMPDKVSFTLMVTNCYRILTKKIKFLGFQPDLNYIETALHKGTEAVIHGRNKYKILGDDDTCGLKS